MSAPRQVGPDPAERRDEGGPDDPTAEAASRQGRSFPTVHPVPDLVDLPAGAMTDVPHRRHALEALADTVVVLTVLAD